MINEIKKIKLNELTPDIIEKKYNEELSKKKEELEKLKKMKGIYWDEDIQKIEQEIVDMKKVSKEDWIKGRITNAKTLKDMGISFEEAISILSERDIPIVLTEEDKVITQNESEFEDMSDLMFVHKTRYFPQDGIIKTPKDAGAIYYKNIMIDGKKQKIGGESSRETIHFTLNTEVTWNSGAIMRRCKLGGYEIHYSYSRK